MAFTKVVGPGIHTLSNILSHNINSSGIITATKFVGPITGGGGDFNAGIITATSLDVNGNGDISGNLVLGGDLTVNGTTTTLDTNLIGVDRIEVLTTGANVAVAVTHNGSGDLVRLYDGSSQKVTVDDQGNVGIGSEIPSQLLDVAGTIKTANITSNSSNLSIENTADRVLIKSANRVDIADNMVRFQNRAQNATLLEAVAGASGYVKLFHNDSLTASVTQDALTVTGRTSNSGMIEIASNQGANDNDRFRLHKTSAAERLTIQNYASGNWVENIRITAGGAVELKHSNGTTVLETKGYGIDIAGGFTQSGNSLIADDGKLQFGGSSDLRIYHNTVANTTSPPNHLYANSNYIDSHGAGNLFIRTAGTVGTYIGNTDGEHAASFHANGSAVLYWDASERFRTTTDGISVTGDIGSASAEIGDVYLADNKRLKLGSDQDMQIFHDNTHGYVANRKNNLYLEAVNYVMITSADTSGSNQQTSARFLRGGKSEIYHSDSIKFETSATGITVTGEVAASQDYPNYRPEFDFNFAAAKKLDARMTFTRAGEASFHDGAGSVKFASDNEPRFDHDILTGECKGLLVEPAGTNYSWYSTQFRSSGYSSGSWVPQNGGATPTITENTHTAPDGTSSGVHMADTITGATGTAFNGNVVRQDHTAGANVKHTFSIYIKLLTATQATIYIRDGATGSVSSTNAVNTKDWQRVVVTSNNALTNSTSHGFFIGNTNGTIAVWGSQIERSSYASSYIKTTTGANGTRAADFPRLETEDFTDMISQDVGTFITEFDNQSNDGYVLSLDAGGNPKIGMVNNDGYQLMGIQDSGASLGTTDNGTVLDGTNKFALAYEVNNAAISINGNDATVDTSYTPLPTTTFLWFGLRQGQYDHLGGAISRVMYYKQRLSNSQLKTLTS